MSTIENLDQLGGADSADFRYTPPTRLSSLSVVMPAHNEADNIEEAVLKALEAASSVTDNYEVVVVDDGSTDNTGDVVRALAEVVGGGLVRLLVNERNLGYGPTVRRAWQAASKDWILFTDSDCQFDTLHDLPRLVRLTDGADVVTGWRKDRQDGWLRRQNAHLFNTAGRIFFGTGVRDVDCAFKLFRTSALHSLDLTANSAMVNTEMYYRAHQAGLVVRETDVRHLPRTAGESSGGDPRVIARAVREFFSMYHRFNSSPSARVRLYSQWVALSAFVLGLVASVWTFAAGHVLAYGDAEAHLNIAKRVTGALTPGLAQLGSVWLPLPHLLMTPLTVNDWMWRTGLAGAIVNMPCLVVMAVLIYRTAVLLTRSPLASLVAPAAVVLNPNTLYLTGTPMTEVLLLTTATAAVYYLTHYLLRGDTRSLVLTSVAVFLATLSRYDGWMLLAMAWFAVVGAAIWRHRSRRGIEGTVVLFSVVSGAGVGAWLLWNQLIFNDPLYFSESVYGSKEQQLFFLNNGYLPTKGSWWLSLVYWTEDVRLIVGTVPLVLAGAGAVALVWWAICRRTLVPVVVAAVAGSCFVFYVLSLYLGQASLILPRFAKPGAEYVMSNIRYGVQALLLTSLLLAVLASLRAKVLTPVLVGVVAVSSVVAMATGGVWSYNDGTAGLSSQKESKGPDAPPAEDWLRANYDGGLVLMDDFRRPVGPVESGIPMSAFIGTGAKPYWAESLDNPGKHATWLVLQEGDTDAVWSSFTPQSRAIVADHFVEVFTSGNIHVFKRRGEAEGFVGKSGQHLILNGQRWSSVGVNSYDLLAQPDDVAVARVNKLANSGFNTLRTWCFDQDGGLSKATLERLDLVTDTARSRGVKVVCTLTNAHIDYGSAEAAFGPDFYTSASAQQAYRDQVSTLLNYVGADGVAFRDREAFMAWDLINEPRPAAGVTSTQVRAWVESMAGFVGSIDQRHLITVGGEGFTDAYPTDQSLTGAAAGNFADLCGARGITLCSAHLYPKYLSTMDSQEIGEVVQSWRTTADELNRPVVVGEIGYGLSDQGASLEGRREFTDNVARALANSDIDGGYLWDISNRPDADFALAFGDPESDRVLGSWSNLPGMLQAARQ